MKAEIRLTYGRVGELYYGSLWVTVHPTRGMLNRLNFEKYSFPRMMSKLAECVREFEEVEVVFTRSEMEGSHYQLDKGTVDLLRTDPAKAISHMMPESRLVVIRDTTKSIMEPPTGLLRAGHETIAAAFGDQLYCVVDKESRVECPGCGRWSPVTPNRLLCNNTNCWLDLEGTLSGRAWFILNTGALLSQRKQKYYLPRAWNPSRGWITWAELDAMYETFVKEREECFKDQDLDPKA